VPEADVRGQGDVLDGGGAHPDPLMESILYMELTAPYSQACFTAEASMASKIYPPYAVSSIFWCQWTYWCTLVMAVWSYAYMPHGSIRMLLILTPILPALLIAFVAHGVYQACDEFIQSRILRSLVITALSVSFCTFGYFLLELFGFPRLSMLAVNLLGWSVFNAQMLYVIIRSR